MIQTKQTTLCSICIHIGHKQPIQIGQNANVKLESNSELNYFNTSAKVSNSWCIKLMSK